MVLKDVVWRDWRRILTLNTTPQDESIEFGSPGVWMRNRYITVSAYGICANEQNQVLQCPILLSIIKKRTWAAIKIRFSDSDSMQIELNGVSCKIPLPEENRKVYDNMEMVSSGEVVIEKLWFENIN